MTLPHRTSSSVNSPAKVSVPSSAINWFSTHQPRRLMRQSSYRTLMESWRDVQATFSKELQRPSVFGLFDVQPPPLPTTTDIQSLTNDVVDRDEQQSSNYQIDGKVESAKSAEQIKNPMCRLDSHSMIEIRSKTHSMTSSNRVNDDDDNTAADRNSELADKSVVEPAAAAKSFRFNSVSSGSRDQDFIPDDMHINIFELLFYACGVIGFFADTATDIILCHAYHKIGEKWLFSLTLLCAVVPNIVLSLFSLAWNINEPRHYCPDGSGAQHACRVNDKFIDDDDDDDVNHKTDKQWSLDNNNNDHPSALNSIITHRSKTSQKRTNRGKSAFTWFCRFVILLLQLDLCFKYLKAFTYTFRGYCYGRRRNRSREKYYLSKQIHIDADIALLRVFDVFMDSGAQVILQLYVLASNPEKLCRTGIWNCGLNAKQILSIGCSLLSLSYTIAGYNRCLRMLRLTRKRSSWPHLVEPVPMPVPFTSTIVNFIWCMLIIIPRVLALALFASVSIKGFWSFVFIHWFCMLLWIVRSRTDFCIGSTASPHIIKTSQLRNLVETTNTNTNTNKIFAPNEPRRKTSRKLILFERCYNFVCSYVYIFCYMNLKSGPTRLRYLIYYTIFYIENVALSLVYFKLYRVKPVEDPMMRARISTKSYKTLMLCTIIIGFWIGLLIQLVYYLAFHPSKYVRRRLRFEIFRSKSKTNKRSITIVDAGENIEKLSYRQNRSSINLMDLNIEGFDDQHQQQQRFSLNTSWDRSDLSIQPRPRSISTPNFVA